MLKSRFLCLVLLIFVFVFAGLNFFQKKEIEELELKLTKYQEYSQELARLYPMMEIIQENFVNEDKTNVGDLVDYVIQKMLEALGPHNYYLTQEEYESHKNSLKQRRVYSWRVDNGVGYIRIPGFYVGSEKDFDEAHNNLINLGVKDIIVDVRYNLGGNSIDVRKITSRFFSPGTLIGFDIDKKNVRKNYYSFFIQRKDLKSRLIVLVDEYSASASEFFTAAIKDNKRGLILGRITYGKGLVGGYFKVEKDNLLITVKSFYGPGGGNIEGVGIEPDIVLEKPLKKIIFGDRNSDPELQTAISFFSAFCDDGSGVRISCYDYFLNKNK